MTNGEDKKYGYGRRNITGWGETQWAMRPLLDGPLRGRSVITAGRRARMFRASCMPVAVQT
jgi:hypothetical protein